jgi:hypothetical protein
MGQLTSSRVRVVALCVAVAGSLVASNIAVAGQCSDPWVTQAVTKYLHRAPSGPSAPECNTQLYRNGHWKSQKDLDAAVDAYWATHPYPAQARTAPPAHVAPQPKPQIQTAPQSVFQNQNGAGIMTNSSGNVIGPHGSGVVSQGGGNAISNNGSAVKPGNRNGVVSQGGGNVVSQGGGNIMGNSGGNLVGSGGASLQHK